MLARVIEGVSTDGDDVIKGFNAGETIEGGAGDDWIDGARGSDTYRFSRGDGKDVIVDSGFQDDTLELFGYAPADVTIRRDPRVDGAVILTFAGTDDEIRLNVAENHEGHTISQIVFEDTTVWSRAEIDRRAVLPIPVSDGDDIVVTLSGDDTVDAGPGDDAIDTGEGNDIIVFGRGDGRDTVTHFRSGTTLRLTDLNPGDITIIGPGSEDSSLTIQVNGARDSIRFASGYIIDQIEFADGTTVWNSTDIDAATVERPTSPAPV